MAKKNAEELLNQVHLAVDSLCKASSDRWTTENLGGVWPDDRWQEMANESCECDDEDDWEKGLLDENKDWRKEAAKFAKLVVKNNLPLTMANMELAFSGKLPGKTKKKVA
jgi:hypothetical protein